MNRPLFFLPHSILLHALDPLADEIVEDVVILAAGEHLVRLGRVVDELLYCRLRRRRRNLNGR